MSVISQKDYLKKYLKIGKKSGEKKKKKKVETSQSKGLKIIDDDVYTSLSQEIQDDLNAANEDAPQIVAVIDERPPSLRIDENKSKLWQPIGETAHDAEFHNFKIGSIKLSKNKDKHTKNVSNNKQPIRACLEDDFPVIKRENEDSPCRKGNYDDYSPPRRKNSKKDDYSPPRRNDGPKRRDDDYSPPRRRDDSSPKRRNEKHSPVNRKNLEDKDYSPPRRRVDDQSPPRRNKKCNDNSTQRRNEKDSSLSRRNKKSRWATSEDEDPPKDESQKPKMTLSGKKSGLQSARNLVEDINNLQKQEEQMFKLMSSDVSGANAATVVRKRKKEEAVDPEKEQREKELKEKYTQWGKGVKQVQDEHEKFADQLKEMNKPLARYADDEDLEKYLKQQEREGDPMLAYIRKKKKKVAVEKGIPEKPMYMGDFMPNRFGIPPGYRWDGVDRSNGYESKWFKVQNSNKAMQEEALQWSQEDM